LANKKNTNLISGISLISLLIIIANHFRRMPLIRIIAETAAITLYAVRIAVYLLHFTLGYLSVIAGYYILRSAMIMRARPGSTSLNWV
jgi:hypothetical protein